MPPRWLPILAVCAVTLVVGAMPASAQCKMAPATAFAQATTGANLGCATSEPFTTAAAEQPFERGTMLWLQEWGSITVFKEGGAYESHEDLFSPGEPESMNLTPPSAELQEPKQGFGAVWRKLGGETAAVGWASAPESSYVATVQYFERGAAIQRGDGGFYVLAIFNHARGQWRTS
jgi:hypothetical protein